MILMQVLLAMFVYHVVFKKDDIIINVVVEELIDDNNNLVGINVFKETTIKNDMKRESVYSAEV
jgi:hypothetical protein